MNLKVKTVIEHLEELIEFYKEASFADKESLRKLVIRNLQDVRRRAEKEVNKNETN